MLDCKCQVRQNNWTVGHRHCGTHINTVFVINFTKIKVAIQHCKNHALKIRYAYRCHWRRALEPYAGWQQRAWIPITGFYYIPPLSGAVHISAGWIHMKWSCWAGQISAVHTLTELFLTEYHLFPIFIALSFYTVLLDEHISSVHDTK